MAAILQEELADVLRHVETPGGRRIFEPFFSSDDYAIESEKKPAAVP
jgi:hypothetical protein